MLLPQAVELDINDWFLLKLSFIDYRLNASCTMLAAFSRSSSWIITAVFISEVEIIPKVMQTGA